MSRSVNERSGSRPRVAESNVTRETPNACAAGHCWASHCWKAALAANDGAANNNIVISPRKNRIRVMSGFTSEIHVPESWQCKDRHGRKKPGHDDLPRELLVLQPMRDHGIGAKSPHLIGFVILEVSFKPLHVAVTLERQNMRGDAVQKPAIVADDHRAAGEIFQRLFKSPQGFHVEVIGRLVEEQKVGTGTQHFRKMHAVAFPARQRAYFFLLIGTLEVEGGAIGARVHLFLAKKKHVI